MKKLLLITAILFSLPLNAMAATSPLEDILGEDTLLFTEINPANLPDFLKEYYKTFLSSLFSDESYSAETQKTLKTEIAENLTSFYIFLENAEDEEVTLAFPFDEVKFNSISEELNANDPNSFGYANGYIFSNDGKINEFLDKFNCTDDCKKLSENSSFIDISKYYKDKSITNVYASNLNELIKIWTNDEIPLTANLGAFGYSAFMGEKNLSTTQVLTNGKSAAPKIKLHEKLPNLPTAVLFDRSQFNDIKSYIEGFTEEAVGLTSKILEPFYNQEIAIAIQDQNETVPAITFLMTTEGHQEEIKSLFIDSFYTDWENMKKIATTYSNINGVEKLTSAIGGAKTIILRTKTEIDNTTFDKLNITIGNKWKKNPYGKTTDLNFNLTFGITNDGTLLFSTDKEIEKNYGQGVNLKDLNTSDATGLFYMNSENMNLVLQNSLKYFNSPLQKTEKISAFLEKLFENMEILTQIENQQNNKSISNSNLDLDLNGIYNLFSTTNGNELNREMSNNFLIDNQLNGDLTNIANDLWYSDAFYYLATTGINDFSSFDFVPAKEISRSEYVHMIMNLLNYVGFNKETTNYEILQFPDTDADPYYWDIWEAKQLGIVKGDANGNFNPNQSLNRAEAAEIMKRVLELLGKNVSSDETMQFIDVNEKDWFYTGVKTVFQNKVMRGTGNSFAPGSFLNQAELMMLTKNLYELIK